MEDKQSDYKPEKINIFSYIIYKICTVMIHMLYKIISNILPQSMKNKYDMIIDNITSTETNKDIIKNDKILVKMSKFIKSLIWVLDLIILVPVSVLSISLIYFVLKWKLTE